MGRKPKKRQVLEKPKEVHRIEPGTLRGGVLGGFFVKHERTTDLSRWAAAAY